MSKKILSESQVRQFMKYANIGALADGFIKENYGMADEVDLDGRHPHEEGGEGASEVHSLEGDLDESWQELDEEEDMGEPAASGADEGMIKDLVSAIADAIKAKTGVDISVDGGGEAPVDDMDLGDEEDMDLGGDEEDMDLGDEEEDMDLGDEEEDMDLGDEEEGDEEMDLDEVVAQISERVARRVKALKESNNKKAAAGRNKLAEARRRKEVARRAEVIAERIMNRITKNR
jgi:hypothetical protein